MRRLWEEREKNLVQTSGVHESERRTTALSIGVLIRWREREGRCEQRKKMMRERGACLGFAYLIGLGGKYQGGKMD